MRYLSAFLSPIYREAFTLHFKFFIEPGGVAWHFAEIDSTHLGTDKPEMNPQIIEPLNELIELYLFKRIFFCLHIYFHPHGMPN